jgi:hypothetical protein
MVLILVGIVRVGMQVSRSTIQTQQNRSLHDAIR